MINFHKVASLIGIFSCVTMSTSALADNNTGWSFGMNALYVQTNNLGPTTGTVNAAVVDDNISFNTSTDDTQADWQWGFQMEAAYYFNTNNDIAINWTHFVHSSNQTVTGTPYLSDTTYSYPAGFYLFKGGSLSNALPVDTISTSVGNNFDAVNLEIGQLFQITDRVGIRFHMGLEYASIDQSVDQRGWNSSDSTIYDDTRMQSQFDGIGPRAGLNTSYQLIKGFDLFGDVAAGLLVGDRQFNATQTTTANDESFTTARQESLSSDDDNVIVPEVDAALGIRYTYPLAQGNLSAELGYQIANYWNAAVITNSDSYNGSYMGSEVTNFGFSGLMFGLTWQGNA